MKRCPECGFRAADTMCPLCGVKMCVDPAPIQTHTHSQAGERCTLPNRTRMPVKPLPTKEETYRPERTGTRRQSRATPNFGAVAFIVIVFILLRSCA